MSCPLSLVHRSRVARRRIRRSRVAQRRTHYHSRRMPSEESRPKTGPSAWIVAAAYLLLTLVFTYPLSLHPASTIIWRNADTDLFMWTLAWNTHAIVQQPLAIFDANIYYPYLHTLAYSENLLGSTIFAAPVLWTTANPVLALNA